MRKSLSFLTILCISTLLSAPASASWSGFVSTGNATGLGNPSCAFVSTGTVVCAVRNGTAALMVNTYSNAKWSTWKNLVGAVESDPSCTSDGAGNVVCAALATNGTLLETRFNGSTWSTPATIKATLYSAPGCAELSAGEVLCAARSASGGLSYSIYNGTSWSAFANLTASAVSAPACTTDNAGGVVCSFFATNGITMANRYNGTKWQGFLNLGGTAAANPDCSSLNTGGKVVCFAEAYNSGIYATEYNAAAWAATSWSTYVGLGGTVSSNAGCTTQSAGLLVCGAIGVLDNAFYGNTYNGSTWSSWTKIGSIGVGVPACAPLGTGEALCVFNAINNKLTSVVGP